MIWCQGMYASGSTWLFNATRESAQAVRECAPAVRECAPAVRECAPAVRDCAPAVAKSASAVAKSAPAVPPLAPIISKYVESLSELKRLPPGALRIIKTHHLPPPAEQFLALQATKILVSIRDPRDAVVSLMQHMRHNFASALDWVERSAGLCAQFAPDRRTELFAYEAGFIDDPATFDRLAGIFGGSLTGVQRERLFARSRRAAIEARIAKIEDLPTAYKDPRSGDIVDLDTQWHRHHAGRSGESGRWRQLLSGDAVTIIEQRMAGFMRQFGYTP